MVTEALSSEETTVEAAITAVSGLSSYFSAVVALAVEAAITAADVAAAADNHYLPAEGNFPLPFSSVLESTSLLVESNFKLQLFMSRSVFYI